MSSRPSRGAARLAAILDALPDALVLVNANGTVVNANAIALEAFETPGTALVGRGLLDLLPEFDSRLIPGSMRRPDTIDERGRTKPTRMTARRTDGTEFPVEVTSSPLEDGRHAYDNHGYTGDELLMLVVRDLSGTVDTEAELARSQRQTEMILRAAAEGVVGTDTDGRVVLVNPAAAQILGFRASDLGGQELHPLVLHSRADGEPFPYEESPLADTLRSGRKHRVRGQVLWSKSGAKVPVDLTTSPVRDGDQLVGAVMTFTDRRPYDELAEKYEAALARHAEETRALNERHAEEIKAAEERRAEEIKAAEEQRAEALAAEQERYAALAEREKDRFEELAEREKTRYESLAARHEQLLAVLGSSLRGPLDELRRELSALAADDAGQLWPEANQVLHHLSAGYARMTTLVDNVLGFQRLDAGDEQLSRTTVMLDAVVSAGVEGAVELIGPGRAQFAVHAPPIEIVVDAGRLATAIAHLVADVAGIDATGNTRADAGIVAAGGYVDSTIVVAAAQRGEVVRIEVRGPYAGGDPVHEPIVRGIVRAHGGVLQTHEVPGMSGSAYVLEVPVGAGSAEASGSGGAGGSAGSAGAVASVGFAGSAGPAASAGSVGSTERAVSGRAVALPGGSVTLPEQASGAADSGAAGTAGGGRRRARRPSTDSFLESGASGGTEGAATAASTGTGRRRGRRAAEAAGTAPGNQDTLGGRSTGAEPGAGPSTAAPAAAATGSVTGPGAQVPSPETVGGASGGTGRRRGRPSTAESAEGAQGSAGSLGSVVTAAEHAAGSAALGQTVPPQGVPVPAAGTGRRARRAGEQHALPALASGPSEASGAAPGTELAAVEAGHGDAARPSGRRARRALAAAKERAAAEETNSGRVFALPPADADRAPSSQGPGAQETVSAYGHAVLNQDAVVVGQGVVDQGVVNPAGVAPGSPVQGPVQGQGQVAAGGQSRIGHAVVNQAAVSRPGPVVAPPLGQGHPAAPGSPAQHAAAPHGPGDDHTPPQPHPTQAPTGRRRSRRPITTDPAASENPAAAPQVPGAPAAPGTPPVPPAPAAPGTPAAPATPAQGTPAQGTPAHGTPSAPGAPQSRPVADPGPLPAPQPWPDSGTPAGGVPVQGNPHSAGTALPPERGTPGRAAQPLPAEAGSGGAGDPNSTQGRAFSVRTLGQGVPFGQQITEQQARQAPHTPRAPLPPQAAQPEQPVAGPMPQGPAPASPAPDGAAEPPRQAQAAAPAAPQSQTLGGSGRRRRLATPPEPTGAERAETPARPHPQPHTPPPAHPQSRIAAATEGAGRSYAIGAPDEDADEGPEPLDGPGGAVEVSNRPQPRPMDDELPPEPLDNPRRLLVWPAPDVTTQQALSDRGYRPVIVHSREEVDAQIAAFPAALFVDPLTGPITRTALQSLRQAAVAAEVPVLVTAGLGQATREAAYGADPAVLLKALAPRDSEQHPPRVLLIEEHEEIALALTSALERRGMQVARAASDADAVTLAAQMRPNLVVMDLLQVRRRRAGIIDWLRANGQLNRTPLVVYTAAVDETELPRLAAGETVLFLAERSTSTEVQSRIVDLLAKIGTN
ncbi:hybrid sensor histidine kinase/response regulator [Streptomyces huasconensis]|uniref:hybrid sensor histidine kinase/response regulator n=1 Tax=Streptomyces huasconensis TaxID=1854574 RepID=UPI0034071A77